MYRWLLLLALFLTACATAPPQGESGIERIVVGTLGGGWSHINPLDPLSPYKTYVVRADGGGEISATLPPGLADEPRWSPDGKWVVYTTDFREGRRAGSDSKLYLMRADGSRRVKISDYPYDDSAPVWSHDGTRIAYESAGITVLNVECYLRGESCRPQPTILTRGHLPDWSPDGKRIAYIISDLREGGSYVINAEGGEPIKLAPSMSCTAPKWSPGGRKIAMDCSIPYAENTSGIYVMDADGSGLVRLTDSRSDGYPQWSPDGSRIAFISEREGLGLPLGPVCGSGCATSSALFIMNADGSDIRRLTKRDDESILWYTWLPRDK